MLLLLRKWVRGARLVNITQLPWERVIVLHFSGGAGPCQLAVELIGRYSNLVLIGSDGLVLTATKYVGPEMSRYRTVLPAQPYQSPPLPPKRQPPTALTVADWAAKLTRTDELDEPLQRWLVGQLLAVSPLVAREICVRATGDVEAFVRAVTPAALYQAVRELFAPLETGWWAPHVALDDSGAVIAFTVFEPRQFSRFEPAVDIHDALWRFFQARGLSDVYAAARRGVQGLLDEASVRLDRRRQMLLSQVQEDAQLTDLRVSGELLLTYLGQVERGADEVTLPDHSGNPRRIVLDPRLSPVENAQAFFRRYGKAHRAAKQIPGMVEDLKAEQAYLEQLSTDLALAESRLEIDTVREALVEAGWAPKRRESASKRSEPRRFEIQGFPIYVGRNVNQNERVTFERGAPEDLWLHVRDLPGAHVLIKRGRTDVPDQAVELAARLAAFYSRARDSEGRVPVDVTERRFVRRMRGRRPGMVTYAKERTVFVRIEAFDPDDV
jgi:predicted ribosome quality control (RQC) complex YloA/Tae2 family protein